MRGFLLLIFPFLLLYIFAPRTTLADAQCPDNTYYWDSAYNTCVHKYGGVSTGTDCRYAFDAVSQNFCSPPCDNTSQACNFNDGSVDYGANSGSQSCSQTRDNSGQCQKTSDCGSCQPQCNPSRFLSYCNGNTIYKRNECADKFRPDLPGEFVEDCTKRNGGESDWKCYQEGDQATCKRHYETQISFNPNPPLLGEPATLSIRGTNSCGSSQFNPTELGGRTIGNISEATDGFENTKKFNNSCEIKYQGCNQAGELPCLWQVQCTPSVMTLNDTDSAKFHLKFNSLAPLIAASSRVGDCNSNIDYHIDPRDCRKNTKKPVIDQTAPKTDEVTTNTLNNDEVRARTWGKATLPEDLYKAHEALIPSSTSTALPETGVQSGFFADLFRNLLCSNPVSAITNIFGFRGYFCPAEVNFANRKTDYVTKLSQTLAVGERAAITPTPVLKSCYLEDIENSTKGNEDINTLDTSFATNSGLYSASLPQFNAQPPPEPGQTVGGISSSDLILDTNNSNLSLGQKVVVEDLRAPDIGCRRQLYDMANYPKVYTSNGLNTYRPLYQKYGNEKDCVAEKPTN